MCSGDLCEFHGHFPLLPLFLLVLPVAFRFYQSPLQLGEESSFLKLKSGLLL
jgi:hypothetical protein